MRCYRFMGFVISGIALGKAIIETEEDGYWK